MTRPLMKVTTIFGVTPVALLLGSLVATAPLLAASAGDQYSAALSHERGLRAPADTPATLTELRRGIARYEDIVRQYPRSGYSDNALWQAAGLALEAYDRYGDVADQQRGERLLRMLVSEYPSSSLVPRVATRLASLVPLDASADATQTGTASVVDAAEEVTESAPVAARTGPVNLRSVTRETLSDVVRVTLELDDEVPYFSEHLDAPARLYFDLSDTDVPPALLNATLPFDDGDIVREVRTGRHAGQETRVVIDVEGAESYSVYALYNPYRLVVDTVRLPELVARSADSAQPPAEAPDEPQPDPWVPEAVEPIQTASAEGTPDIESPLTDIADLADDRLTEPVGVVVDAAPPSEEIPRSEDPAADAPQTSGLDLLPVPEGWSSVPLAALDAAEPVDPGDPGDPGDVDEPDDVLADASGALEPAPEAAQAEGDRAWPTDHELLYPNLGTPPPTLEADAATSLPEPTTAVPPVPAADVSATEVISAAIAPVATADIAEPTSLAADLEVASLTEPVAALPASTAVRLAEAPSLTADGAYSLGRQLGLGISRVVIDPGHGGYDPGARSGDLAEAQLVLDVAERLESKLVAEGIEVVLTRRSDVYVPLRARTELANRVGADLFLSIHANAAEDPEARGIETYHLDFATDPTAKAVAARENAASGDSMHDLPELVRSIAMENKVDESRELALLVQRGLVAGVRQSRPDAQDLGVKQAPFMVLIGATMPSVLTEISFLTNEEAAAHLATSVYRDQIAEALFESLLGYQRALKPATRVAANDD